LGWGSKIITPITDAVITRLPTPDSWRSSARWVPRDGDAAASYAVLNTDRLELTYCCAAYDIAAAAAKIPQQGFTDLAR